MYFNVYAVQRNPLKPAFVGSNLWKTIWLYSVMHIQTANTHTEALELNIKRMNCMYADIFPPCIHLYCICTFRSILCLPCSMRCTEMHTNSYMLSPCCNWCACVFNKFVRKWEQHATNVCVCVCVLLMSDESDIT